MPFGGSAGTAGDDTWVDTSERTADAAADATFGHPTVQAPEGGTCKADAETDGADPCELPPSLCADGRWLAFFREPKCAASGQCSWSTAYRDCGDLGCQHGGCVLNVTH